MRIETAIKITLVLLIIIVTALIAALFIIKNTDEPRGTEPAPQTTTDPEITEPDITTPEDTTTPENTTVPGGTTIPDQTTTPESTTSPDQTTNPDQTTPDKETDVPDDFYMKKTFYSDSGTYLNIKAVLTATEDAGKVRVVVELYLEHYSIKISGRKYGCKLNFGDVKGSFSTEGIELEENVRTLTPLHMIEGTFEYGETYDLYASFPANCTYGEIELENLIISESITLE
jgi:hypothetical protein